MKADPGGRDTKGGSAAEMLRMRANMGSQFWWFYDVIAAALVLVSIFLAGRKGAFKALISAMCFIVGLVICFSVSSTLASSIEKNLVRPSNVKNLNTALSEMEFNAEMERYLNEKYDVLLDTKKVDEIFYAGEDIEGKLYQYLNAYTSGKVNDRTEMSNELREGYAQVISTAVGKHLNKYAAEMTAKNIREGKGGNIYDLIRNLQEPENRSKASEFIARNYTAKAYEEIVKQVALLALFLLVVLITYAVVRSFTRNSPDYVSLGSHIGGGFTGIAIGAVLIVIAAAIVRINVILGSNEMLFFNHDVISKTYVFKYAYDFISSTK